MNKVFEIITEKILTDITTNKKLTWVKEWSTENCMGFPKNGVTKKPYNGVNFFLLSMSNYKSPYWYTFKQVTELNGKVKKGAKSTMIVFWNIKEEEVIKDNGEKEKNKRFLLRYYNVFNLEQTEGITIESDTKKILNPNEIIEEAEKVVDTYIKREKITYQVKESDKAYYVPLLDKIVMPKLEQFSTSNAFYATAFHEIGHSTGAKNRLNRKEIATMATAFSKGDYGLEELVAELTSAFLCSQTGISNDTIERNSTAYLQNWYNAIKADPKMFIMASTRASKAVNYINESQIN